LILGAVSGTSLCFPSAACLAQSLNPALLADHFLQAANWERWNQDEASPSDVPAPMIDAELRKKIAELQEQLDNLRRQVDRPPQPPPPAAQPPSRARRLMTQRSDFQGMAAPAAADVGEPETAAATGPADTTGEPGFFAINNVSLSGRAAIVVDTTQLDSRASGLFLPSAIPARGEPAYKLGERTTFQGNGSSIGLGWLAQLGTELPISGGARVQLLDTASGNVTAAATQAWLQWENLVFGVTDSTFTDLAAIPETIDLGGPSGRPWFYESTPQIRYKALEPSQRQSDPTGLYGDLSVELPDVDIYLPDGMGYATRCRYPDFVATLRYQAGQWAQNKCLGNNEYREFWHLQVGALVRDLGLEQSDGLARTWRKEVTGWGVQLSGRYAVYRDPSWELRDYAFFSITGGEGIARYFNDLHMVSPTYDVSFNPSDDSLTPLPVLAYFAAYQHDWTRYLRSTAVYSHVDVESLDPAGMLASSPYRRGDYLSLNLMYHKNVCGPHTPPSVENTEHTIFAGVEYLFGQKENLDGARGESHRLMLVIAATN